ncbi:hypothetical protein [Tabrizicola sp.]|uniref:hypothetical protein n=1 Tax=Tabrizicola sp. TaxID=2005166 RepID=UPI003F36E0CA
MRLTLALLLLSAGAAFADAQLAGTYEGEIQVGDASSALSTFLAVAGDGTVTGSYSYMDGQSQARGVLMDCAYASPILQCSWRDVFGGGALVLRFTPDASEFTGSWYDDTLPKPHDSPDNGFAWTGKRKPSS